MFCPNCGTEMKPVMKNVGKIKGKPVYAISHYKCPKCKKRVNFPK